MRLSDSPAPSYYAASLGGSADLDRDGMPAPRETLRGAIRADVAILGGGIAGCSAALHLAKRGYRVVLLEARTVGFGASGRSGGQTIFGLAVSQKTLAAEVKAAEVELQQSSGVLADDIAEAILAGIPNNPGSLQAKGIR